jgi:hypothetical protein
MKKLLLSVLAATAFAGCMTHGDVGVGYSYGYAQPAPDMYVVSDGVNVVAYADYPTFYSDNYYWMYNGGTWYRSSYYGGGWAVSYDVPYRVRSIREPHSYAHFQGGAGYTRYNAGGTSVRDHRYNGGGYNNGGYNTGRAYNGNAGPAVRDHRTAPPAYQAPQPDVRDHRAPAASYSPPSPPPARDHRAEPAPAERQPVDRNGPRGNPPARDHRH